MMDKRQLRRIVKAAKESLSPAEKRVSAESIGRAIEALPQFAAARRILLYHSLPDEVATHIWIQKWQHTKTLYLPVVEGDTLRVCPCEGDLHTGAYGIKEPGGESLADLSVIDLVIVPGVAFDADGNRLGRGKGYYDRLLPQIAAPRVGVAYDCQIVEHIPADPHDIPMTLVVTPGRIYTTGNCIISPQK